MGRFAQKSDGNHPQSPMAVTVPPCMEMGPVYFRPIFPALKGGMTEVMNCFWKR